MVNVVEENLSWTGRKYHEKGESRDKILSRLLVERIGMNEVKNKGMEDVKVSAC